MAAIHQDPIVASNEKSKIWASDKLYAKYFSEETTATHIVFAYSLLRCVEARKLKLVEKSKRGEDLTELEERELDFFRNRGATFLLVSAISSCLETILKKRIPNVSRLSFGQRCSPIAAERHWVPIVDAVAPFSQRLQAAFTHGLKSGDLVTSGIRDVQSLVLAVAGANSAAFARFTKHVIVKRK